MISRYNKVIPLEIPKDSSTELFVKGLEQVNKRAETTSNELIEFTDKISAIDLIRPIDKSYFDSKYNTLVNQVNELAKTDLSNPSFVNTAKKTLGELLKDPKIIQAKQATENIRLINDQWSKIMTNPKLLETAYRPQNYRADMNRISEHLNNPEVGVSFGQKNASVYTGIYEKLDTQGQKFKESINEIPQENLTNLVIKYKSLSGLHSMTNENPTLDNQLKIDYEDAKFFNKNLDTDLVKSLDSQIKAYENNLRQMQVQSDLVSESAEYKPEYQHQVGYHKAMINKLKILKDRPDASFEIFKNNYSESFAAKHYHEDKIIKTSPAIAGLQYGLNVAKARADEAYKNKALEIKEKEIELGKYKTDVENGIGLGMTSIYEPALDLPAATTVDGENSFTKTLTESTNTLHRSNLESLKNVINRVNSLPGSRERNTIIEQKLKEKGITLDLDNTKTVNEFLLVPANLAKFTAVIDHAITNSGSINQNPSAVKIMQELEVLNNNSMLVLAKQSTLNEARNNAKANQPTGGSSEFWGGVAHNLVRPGTPNPAREVSEGSLMEKNLQTMGYTVYQDKSIPAANKLNDNTKEGKRLSTYLNSLIRNTGYVVDGENKVAYPLFDNIPVADKKVDKGILHKADLSKSDIVDVQPSKGRLRIALADKEGVSLGTYYIRPTRAEMEVVTEMLAPGKYNEYVNQIETFDTFYDNLTDKNVKKIIANQTNTITGTTLGLPTGFHLNYRVLGGSKGERHIQFFHNNKSYETVEFQSVADFKKGLKHTYDNTLSWLINNNKTLSKDVLEKEALKLTFEHFKKRSN